MPDTNPNGFNGELALLPSAARTALVHGDDLTNHGYKGVKLVIDITAWAAGSITVTIQGKDNQTGKYFTILASAALAAVATTVLNVYPGAVVTANLSANDVLPRVWRIDIAVGGAQSITYSVSAELLG